MPEGVKFVGGLMAVVGPLGVVSGIKTREKRHAELIQATKQPVTQAPVASSVTTTSDVIKDRLTGLEQLRRDGLVSGDEYEAKRREILDSL